MRSLVSTSLAAALAMALLPPAARAQQVRAGAEFQANTATTAYQRLPDVHFKANGDFVVAWAGDSPLDGDRYGISARRFDVTGAPQGGEFRVNTHTTDYQFKPVLASDAKGNFVVVWSSYLQDGSDYGVFGQRFAADGTPRGGEFMVNTFTLNAQGSSYYYLDHNHTVGMAPNGNFVVVWGSYHAGQDGDGSSVHGQRFDANGARLGGEMQLNTYTTGDQFSPSVAVNADNTFVVVWAKMDAPGNFGVVGQLFDANGVRVGAEFQVPQSTAPLVQQAAVVRAAADKSFVVTWSEGANLVARRFTAAGAPSGAQFQVNSTSPPAPYSAYAYSQGMDRRGNFVVNWNRHNQAADPNIGGRRFLAAGTPREPESTVNLTTAGVQFDAAVASDDVGNVLSAWTDNGRDGDGLGVFVQRFGGLRPAALNVDTAGNRVLEPGETAGVLPSWRNVNGAAQTFGGALGSIAGPAGFTYTITDGTAAYGTVANGAIAPCTDCYAVAVSNPPARPAAHVDASAVETITPDAQGQHKQWVLHVGASFTDVPATNPFYRFVETLLHNGVTGGCSATAYCPAANTTREQMAVFVLVAKEGPTYLPPACAASPFPDVPASSPFCRWIAELALRGVVGGCGGGNYCPASNVSRDQMAVFVLRTLDPALNPPACAPPNLFADVPETSPFCRWVEELANRAVVSGCGGGNYCPLDPVTREQMGVFISVTFGLVLYGV